MIVEHKPAGMRVFAFNYTRGEQVILTRDLPNRSRIVAIMEIRRPGECEGLSPGFSLTVELYEAHGTWSGAARQRNGRESDMGGQLHDEILRAFPKLAPFERVHLANLDGTPWSAVANASWYYGHHDRPWFESVRAEMMRAAEWSRKFPRSDTLRLGELLSESETLDGRRHYANRWAADPAQWRTTGVPAYYDRRTGETVTVGAMTWAEIAHARAASQLGVEPSDLPRGLDRGGWENFCADQVERWRWEAYDAVQVFNHYAAKARQEDN